MKKTFVTTSWDDGHVLDMKLAALLDRYTLPATLYIAPSNREIVPEKRMTAAQVRELAKRFEIGAHTMTHPRLPQVSPEAAREEIALSKSTLEDWTGKEVAAFCYPCGDFTPDHEQMVKDAGFALGRTVERFCFDVGDPYTIPTTLQAYRHWSDIRGVAAYSSSVKDFFKNYFNWDDLAIALFEDARKNGGIFHLWGHSWEIEKFGAWDRLERVFAHISGKSDVEYVTNSQLLKI